MKIIKNFISAIAIACVLASVSLTAFASNLYEQVQYLSEDELFDEMWNAIIEAKGTEQEMSTGNTFILSYTYQDLKEFIKTYQIPTVDFTVADMRDVYCENFRGGKIMFYGNETVIEPYSETVADYKSKHPNAQLTWNYDRDTKEYVFFDGSSQIDSFKSDVFITYTNQSNSQKTLWTYDEAKDKYVGKDSNGTLVKSVAKYHIEGEASSAITSSESSQQDTSNSTNSSAMSGGDTSAVTRATEGNTEVVTAANQSASTESNNVSAIQILLVIVGILIIIGIIVIIVMLKRRNNEEK